MTDRKTAIPGQNLGSSTRYLAGPGTHMHNSNLHASILGFIHISAPPKPSGPVKRPTKITPTVAAPRPTISVYRDPNHVPAAATAAVPAKAGPAGITGQEGKEDLRDQDGPRRHVHPGSSSRTQVLPEVNSVVLCRVTRIAMRQATVAILVVGETVLEGEWQGLIRVQDVRATEKDRVKIFESFRPGDIVRAVVISLGDQANYYLSTASNNLGVIMATSEAGNAMYPVSWKEYRDPETELSESRKVAKPF